MTEQDKIELRDLIRDLPPGVGRAVWKEDIRSLNELRNFGAQQTGESSE